jgi:hypothetical protein
MVNRKNTVATATNALPIYIIDILLSVLSGQNPPNLPPKPGLFLPFSTSFLSF